MPRKSGRLTPKELAFVEHMARTGDAPYAASKAGYAYPEARASQLKYDPAIAEATRQRLRYKLQTQGAEVGLNALMRNADDPKQPGSVQVAAGKELARLAGLGFDAGTGDGDEEHTWSLERIRREITKGARVLEELNRPTLELEANPPQGGVFE